MASPAFQLCNVACGRFPRRRVRAVSSSSGAQAGRFPQGPLLCQTRQRHPQVSSSRIREQAHSLGLHCCMCSSRGFRLLTDQHAGGALRGLIVCQAQNVTKKADERSGAAHAGSGNGSAKTPPVLQVPTVGSPTGSPSWAGATPFPFWARAVDVVAKFLAVDVGTGLSAQAVEVRRVNFGWNELEKPSKRPFWQLVAEQFEDTLVQILLAAAGTSLVLAISDANATGEIGAGAFTEPIIILSIVVLNAVVGVWQESRAEGTLEALKCMQSETSRVLRDGTQILDLPTRELVPGDVVELRAGDKVPADMRVIRLKSGTLRTQQSALTGESQPVLKQTEESTEEDIELQGKDCMVFAGTVVTNGTCQCIVTATGMKTEIGKIQSQIQEASLSNYESPLSEKLDGFADLLTKVVGGVCVVVWLVNYKYFISWEEEHGLQVRFAEATYYFKVAVALAVAAIPEGLPAVITTCLALGTRRMAHENAIIRKLPSVETLGCTTVICSDKTGTLTTNQMSVKEITAVEAAGQLRTFTVGGTTYDPRDGEVQQLPALLDLNLQSLAKICALCNDAVVQSKDKKFNAIGLPTEAALLVLAEKLGLQGLEEQDRLGEAQTIKPDALFRACAYWGTVYRRLFTLEFDRSRKSMSVMITANNSSGAVSGNNLLVKGAAEFVLERCSSVQLKDGSVVPLLPGLRQSIMERVNCMAGKGLRVLAFAFKTDLGILSDYTGAEHVAHELLLRPESYVQLESGLTFVGLTGLQDPPRPEVKKAIEDCTKAGIRVVVITGDNQTTAEAICQEIGLFKKDEDVTRQSFLGREFMRMSQSERQDLLQSNQIPGCRERNLVFSRAEPIHKQEIVRMLKAGNGVVAMTGDGVNDAPALKLADIGIAMGLSGTEVAKEASDMVLADDNFATIVKAVKEGRSIYDNMKAFIRYLISSNIGEVISILLTALLGFPQGLLPVQLLWVNLVTDGAPATALGFNPPDKDIMGRPPRLPSDGLVSGWTLARFMAVGTYVGLATVGIFALWYTNNSTFLGIDLSKDGHSAVTIHQLMNWVQCPLTPEFHANSFTAGSTVYSFSDPCEYFTTGKVKASTLAMTTLVVIEMFNALNALSETNSLFTVPPWSNRWLLLAIAVSLGLHVAILYTPWLAEAFGVVPLSFDEWLLVIAVSIPVIPLDESLKLLGRYSDTARTRHL